MNELSLFSGGGGGLIATSIFLGMKTVGYVEWNPYCQQLLSQRIQDGFLHEAPIFTDIRAFNNKGYAEAYKGMVDIITGGFPCFTSGNLVFTKTGYKDIKDIEVGDIVLTHKGNWKKVISVMSKSGASTRILKGQGFDSIEGTSEHPFYTRERFFSKQKRNFRSPEWTEFGQLRKDSFCCQVKPHSKNNSTYSDNLLWIMGRYVADGHRVRRKGRKEGSGRVVISVGKHKAEEIRNRISEEFGTVTEANERTSTRFHITRNKIYRFSEQFGSRAENKRIPGWMFSLSKEKLKCFLDGYLSGDGSKTETYWRCCTVSKELAYGIALLYQIIYNLVAGVTFTKTPDKKIIEGRIVNQRDYYVVDLPEKNKMAFAENQYCWKQIRENKEYRTNQKVYNIEVKDDNSYTINNVVVHNCQPFSASGIRQGEKDKKNMWPATQETIRIIRPKFLFLENVANLLIFQYTHTIFGDLAKFGYNVKWQVLSAQDVGAFHKRDRLWIFGEKASDTDG